jgi:hypothetical protein
MLACADEVAGPSAHEVAAASAHGGQQAWLAADSGLRTVESNVTIRSYLSVFGFLRTRHSKRPKETHAIARPKCTGRSHHDAPS